MTDTATPRPRILIADDSDVCRTVLAILLKNTGFEVTSVVNGREALLKLRAQSFDLAVLDLARDREWQAVVVLGHPDYYPRFGFSAELASGLDSPFDGDSFMALELVPGALDGEDGLVVYPTAFGLVS